jgi:dephospho-CoA kinase
MVVEYMKIIGLTGGIGSGKSYIADILKTKYNAEVFLTDNIAKELMSYGNACYAKIVDCFGKQILDLSNEIDKVKLSHIIFESKEHRLRLNSIVHPVVVNYIKDSIKKTNKKLVVIESALLIEAGIDKICTELWYIHADIDIRIQRLMKERGYSKEKCKAIIESQLDFEANKNRFNVIIDNSGYIDIIDEIKQQLF